jgi:parvulin-like peptidyl-prolyl isomerase
MRSPLYLFAIATLVVGCQKADNGTGKGSGSGSGSAKGSASATVGSGSAITAVKQPPPPARGKDIDSKDILARTPTATDVDVKHVLISWKDLAGAFGGHMDPRAQARTNDEAVTLAQDVAAKLKADPTQLDAQIKEHSEDPGSLSLEPYNIKADAPFVPEFKNLGLRLNVGEVGIVQTSFGYHVMMRVPPDPLQSNDILARPLDPATTTVQVQHVLIGWKALPGRSDPRAQARTKADADKLAKEILAKVVAKGDMAKLMKEFSEDPGSKDSARVYEVTEKGRMVEPFKNLSLRLKMGEAGLVKSQFGWHIIKRVPPPPPDSLESADILSRKPETDKAKVKHILLGWKEVHAEDERGKKRDRAELEKLVKATVAKLKKGDAIEPLMLELSEDPGSAKDGKSYDVTPDAGLVEPFKNLSLRLKLNEVGVVKTDFGIHIIKRVE